MRTHGFRSNVLLTCVAAAALVLALGRPWYGTAPAAPGNATGPAELNGSMEAVFSAIARSFTGTGGVTGWAAFGSLGVVLAGLALATGLAAVAALAPALQAAVVALLRPVALAAAAVVVYRVVERSGAGAASELRQGALIALVAALVLVLAALGVAGAPSRKRRPVTPWG